MKNLRRVFSVLVVGFFLLASSFSSPVEFGGYHPADNNYATPSGNTVAAVPAAAAFVGVVAGVIGTVFGAYQVGYVVGEDAYNDRQGGATINQLTSEHYDPDNFSEFDYTN